LIPHTSISSSSDLLAISHISQQLLFSLKNKKSSLLSYLPERLISLLRLIGEKSLKSLVSLKDIKTEKIPFSLQRPKGEISPKRF
jgi:hypothetical protein